MCATLNWCSSSASVSAITLFRLISVNSVPVVREKFSRLLTISEARNVCFVILSSSPAFCGSDCSCLASIWVYDEITASGVFTSCATPAASNPIDDSLSAWRELDFEVDALGDVVHDHEAADDVEFAGDQRRHGDIHDARFAGRSCQPELVKIVNARLLPNAVELFDEGCREDLAQGTSNDLPARLGVHDFHLRVPGFDAVLEINGHHADVDRFDDVLVEVLEPLVLADLLFERSVEAGVLDRDSDISG